VNMPNDMPGIEQELRDATHAYADQFEPASDSWARLRARADEVTPRRSYRWIFGIGGVAIATTAAAALAIMLSGDDEAIHVETRTQPPTSAPTTPFVAEGTEELYAFGFPPAESGLARFVRTGEPGADDEWTVELDVTFSPEEESMFSGAYERIGLQIRPPEADQGETGQVEVCSTEPPGADGRITCTATFPASVLPGAVPFGADWVAGLVIVEAGEGVGRISTPVLAPVEADFVAQFGSGDAWGTAYFNREDDGETWTGWVVDAGFTNACWPPDAPPGGPSPCIDRAVLQVGLPLNDDANGAHHMVEVCEIGPADDSFGWRCTGTFSGAAGDTWSAFGTGSIAVLEGDPTDTVTQENVIPLVPCHPAATLVSRINEESAFLSGCAVTEREEPAPAP
jgi:hypothetical protein